MTIEEIKTLPKEEIINKIREKLSFKSIERHLRKVDETLFKQEHKRFEMSGYDRCETGSCVLHNLDILTEFAYLGIYDYTYYLFLDFYKGSCKLYLKYWNENKDLEFDFDSYGTTEIIYKIFELTILSNKEIRRR